MTQATKRVARKTGKTVTTLKLALTPAALEFLERSENELAATRSAFNPYTPPKERRKAFRADVARRAEHRKYVDAYCARFYTKWTHPKSLASINDIVELAVAGLDEVGAARALCVAIVQATGHKLS